MDGDLVTSEAAVPVTESDACQKQDSDGGGRRHMADGDGLGVPDLVPREATEKGLGDKQDSRRRLPGPEIMGPEGDPSPRAQTEAMFTDDKLNTGPSSTLRARRADSEGSRHVGNRPPLLLTSFPAPGLHREFPGRDTGQRTPVPREPSLQLKVIHDDWHTSSCRLPEPSDRRPSLHTALRHSAPWKCSPPAWTGASAVGPHCP